MKNYSQRLNNIKGQLDGVARMIENGESAYKTLVQMKAAKSAFNSAMRVYMEENFYKFMKECSNDEKACQKFFDELINT